MSAVSQANASNPAVKRILREYSEFQQSYAAHRQQQRRSSSAPPLDFVAAPLDDNLFEWHFTLRGPAGTPYASGLYHGRILLPSNYPFRPPDVVLLTPSGRFEVHKKICLSISSFHPANWQPSWSIRTVLTALMAFFPTPAAGAIGSLEYPDTEKAALAVKSGAFTCAQCKCSNAEIIRRHERGHEGEEEEEEEEEEDGGAAALPSVVHVALPPSPSPPPPPPSVPATAPSSSSSSSSSSIPASSSMSTTASPIAFPPVGAAPQSTPSPAVIAVPTASSSPLTASPSQPPASASSTAPPAASSVPSTVPATVANVVSPRPSQLSRVTVSLSLLIVLLLLRKLAAALLSHAQQSHSIALFNAR